MSKFRYGNYPRASSGYNRNPPPYIPKPHKGDIKIRKYEKNGVTFHESDTPLPPSTLKRLGITKAKVFKTW